jgi:hypothetical protein
MTTERRSDIYYVAKNGDIFGPISAAELDGMKKSGQLAQYSWICKEGETEWKAIDHAPNSLPFNVAPAQGQASLPPLPGGAPTPAVPKKASAPAPRTLKVRDTHIDTGKEESFRGILFDSRNAITAWVSDASAEGCEIRSDGENSDPLFVKEAGAVLNLYEVASGKTSNVTVHVSEIFRLEGHWVYKVRWSHVPALFEVQKAS